MTDAQIDRKLKQLVKISNELVTEAKERYGPEGNLFFESEGFFYVMAGDCNGNNMQRQAFIRHRSQGFSRMGAGAW